MKIENLHDLSDIVHGAERKTRESSSGAATFDRFLNQEMAAVQTGTIVQVSAPSSAKTQGLPGAPDAEGAGGTPPLFEALTGVLDRLTDMCSQNLTAQDLEAVAQSLTDLGQAADEVLRRTQSLAEEHPARRIAAEARVLAYVESVKWRRGDYLELG